MATFDFAFPGTRGERPADFEMTLKLGMTVMKLAAEDAAIHKLTAEVQNLLRSRSAYHDPELVKRVLAVVATL